MDPFGPARPDAGAAACSPREQMLVLLSTNDMHARIQYFPQLAAAVAACRDTVPGAVLVDAGDRWTGNAYVDLAPTPGMPIIALMNRLGYDAATLGNHEFDRGQAFLGRMIDSMDFEVVCANVVSDTCTFPSLPPATVLERDGVKIGLVGAVTNYEARAIRPEMPRVSRGCVFPTRSSGPWRSVPNCARRWTCWYSSRTWATTAMPNCSGAAACSTW